MDDVGKADFQCVQGSAWRIHVTFEQPNGSGGWAPINLTGCDLAMDIRPQYADDDVEEPAASATITVINPTAGEFALSLTHDDTAELNGSYVYDVDLTDSGGSRLTLFRGSFDFEPEVTR